MAKSPFWDKEITVFTQHYDSETRITRWYKWHIPGCFVSETKAANFRSPDVWQENKLICRVVKQSNYKPYKEWCGLPNDEKQEHISFAPNKTLIFVGHINESIADNTSGNDLRNDYQNSFMVKSFTDNTSFIPPHYKMLGG